MFVRIWAYWLEKRFLRLLSYDTRTWTAFDGAHSGGLPPSLQRVATLLACFAAYVASFGVGTLLARLWLSASPTAA